VLKSANAFRTISEVADELDVPQHVLRFWESKFTQIKPLKRAGGRRHYRPDDVDLLRGIRSLLYGDGYTIKGVQKVLKDQGARAVARHARPGASAAKPSSPSDDLQLSLLQDPSPNVKAPRNGVAHAEPISAAKRRNLEKLLNELIAIRAMLGVVAEP